MPPAHPTLVTVMSDYGCGFPLWDARQRLLAPTTLPLSPALVSRLERWQQFFEDHFDWDRLWDDPAHAQTYATDGEALRLRVQAELGAAYDVRLDLWPTQS